MCLLVVMTFLSSLHPFTCITYLFGNFFFWFCSIIFNFSPIELPANNICNFSSAALPSPKIKAFLNFDPKSFTLIYRVFQSRGKGFQPVTRQHVLNLCIFVCLASESQELKRFQPVTRQHNYTESMYACFPSL